MPTNGLAFPEQFRGHPLTGFPRSSKELSRSVKVRSPLGAFLRHYAVRDVVAWDDDFQGALNTNYWTAANGGGTGVASFAANAQANGAVRATTGTSNNSTASASLIGPIIYSGQMSAGMEVRFKMVTSAAGVRVEFGFIDAVPGSNTGGINNIDTPTSYFSNGAVMGYDTGASTNTGWTLVTNGSATNQAIKATNTAAAIAAVGTFQTLRVQMVSQDNNVANAVQVEAWVDGALLARHQVSTTAGVGAVNGSVLLAPWFYINALNATSKSVDVDYAFVWADRI